MTLPSVTLHRDRASRKLVQIVHPRPEKAWATHKAVLLSVDPSVAAFDNDLSDRDPIVESPVRKQAARIDNAWRRSWALYKLNPDPAAIAPPWPPFKAGPPLGPVPALAPIGPTPRTPTPAPAADDADEGVIYATPSPPRFPPGLGYARPVTPQGAFAARATRLEREGVAATRTLPTTKPPTHARLKPNADQGAVPSEGVWIANGYPPKPTLAATAAARGQKAPLITADDDDVEEAAAAAPSPGWYALDWIVGQRNPNAAIGVRLASDADADAEPGFACGEFEAPSGCAAALALAPDSDWGDALELKLRLAGGALDDEIEEELERGFQELSLLLEEMEAEAEAKGTAAAAAAATTKRHVALPGLGLRRRRGATG
ncbi:uncharacterized protein BXZ73DRAFT_75279 [Epithele typhae]|uniref:uncharacterized protein n=1 Tax=Epithele typhae TaxID=378194 RepID=UPI002007A637|nr:uncharacterized protein BXZ73DRAFT_75279 [Epithele typhae]KAH9940724.1 hypothetical protein BXZ73DRAFT_75279 [Epithele typhae]